MRKWPLIVALWIGLVPSLFAKNALIVYDGNKAKSEAFKSARYIFNLLDHFTLDDRRLINISEYRSGMAKSQSLVFIDFEEGVANLPDVFLRDLRETRAEIVWINMHINQLLAVSPGKWGIKYDKYIADRKGTIEYRGAVFAKEDPGMNLLAVADPSRVRVLATVAEADGRLSPYLLKSGNLWCFADSPFSYAVEGSRFLILADILHDIIGENHALKHKALIRIEDVNPQDDPASLRRVADYLQGQKVPFQVSLIPIYKDPDNQIEVDLSDRPEVVKALKYMVSRGGTIILHGGTHQNRGSSGEDYEFWDDIVGVPISHESKDWVEQRIREALRECFRNGLYPLAWETPHYSASKRDYRTIAAYFDTFYDRVMAAELSGTQQIFPYPVKLKELGVSVVPENLGYIDIRKPDPGTLLQAARNMLAVRDGLASFFFHPFVPLKHLKTIIRNMKKMGWEFESIRDFSCSLRTESQWVTSAGGKGKAFSANQYIHKLLLDRTGRIEREEYSQARMRGVTSEDVSVPIGSLYVLEAVDFLPAKKETGLRANVRNVLSTLFAKKKPKGIVDITRSLVVIARKTSKQEELDQLSFLSVLKIFGFNPEVLEKPALKTLDLSSYGLVVAPYALAKDLDDVETNRLLEYVEKGGALVTDGRTSLAEKLGILFVNRMDKAREVKELSLPATNLQWDPPEQFYPFSFEEGVVLAEDANTNEPLVLHKKVKKGQVLFFGTLFDRFSSFGMSRYPYFPFYLKNSLGISFNVRRNNLEFYFDPGYRQNTSMEKLVVRWKTSGVKIIYLATWHFYKAYEFPYSYFIDLCHRHGIAVYAWFEFPQVSQIFWEEHPEWREKTATGKDALYGWRRQINLFNPAAREAVKAFFRKLLLDYDWDGVNLAELNFDTNKGAADPDNFTPMNADVRKEFKSSAGFDPADLFKPSSPRHWIGNRKAFERFLKFRTDLVRDLHVFFLEDMEKIKSEKQKDLEVIVTVMDSLLHSEIVEECGINTEDIIGLMGKFPFTLQVEDPARSWAQPPTRYLDYFNVYKTHVRDVQRLMFDINVIETRNRKGRVLPSALPTGTELATTLFYATFASGRTGIYSEQTVLPFDVDILPFVMGSDVEIKEAKNGFQIRAREPFILTSNRQDVFPILNGQKWPFYGSRGIFLPSGEHFLSFKKNSGLDFEVLSFKIAFDGNISSLNRQGNDILLEYHSALPASLTFNRPLEGLMLDDHDVPLAADKNGMILPRGRHRLEIVTESGPSRVVGVVGFVSSSVFYLLGLLSVSLLLGIYIFSRIKR